MVLSRIFSFCLFCIFYLISNGLIGQTTYYSYQNGSWETANTWTTDPSGTLSLNPDVPGAGDHVVILNGRTVTVTVSGKSVESVDIQDGAILDLGTTNGHTFTNLSGLGILKLSSTTLPAGTMTNFVASTGGTIEYTGSTNFAFDRTTFNNLIINLNATETTATINADFTVNGDLHIKRGTLIIGDATTRTIVVEGDVTTDTNGRINVSANDQRHNLHIRGDFTINGAVRFTDLDTPDYLRSDNALVPILWVHVIFDNAIADQHVSINASAIFYRIGINKGTDDTYILHLEASNDSYFKLYGPNNRQTNSPGAPPNIANENALGLEAGTLRLGANIIIPALASSNNYIYTGGGAGRNYAIDQDATLWIDGATVYTTHYKSPSNNIKSIMSVYGKLKITSGSLIDEAAQGIGLRTTGQMLVEGGVVEATVIRTSAESTNHRGAYIQTGGTVTIRRDIVTFDGFSASFHLGFATTSFIMSGGEMNILASTPTTSTYNNGKQFSFVVSSNPDNIEVSGGTINISIPDNRNAYFATSTPFYNLNVLANLSTYQFQPQDYPSGEIFNEKTANPLIVQNDFLISSPAHFNTNNLNLTVGRDFVLEAGATYTPGTNTTIFNGFAGQFFNNAGTITSDMNNVTVSNNSILSISNNLTLRGNLSIGGGVLFRDMGKLVNVQGSISNDGTHESQAGGALVLSGSGDQTIGGDGTGIYGNLWLNKSSGASSLTSNATINGDLRLANTSSILNIGSYRLTLSSTSKVYDDISGSGTNFSSSRMIQTAGLLSDEGVRLNMASTDLRQIPIGVSGKYTPASVHIEEVPTIWGSVSIRPVFGRHPLRSGDNVLSHYWRVTSEGISGIPANSVKMRFYYVPSDVNGDENIYVPGLYIPFGWSTQSADNITIATSEILFDNISSPDGDFTAGEQTSLGAVVTLFSRQTGIWSTNDTWTTDTLVNDPAGFSPTSTTPVVIRNGHTVTISANSMNSGSLTIQQTGILNLGSYTGHNFGAVEDSKVSGNGTIRISSSVAVAQFPDGDFGNFLGENGGTIEYYSGGTLFTLPTSKTYYNNLIINPGAGAITLPNIDLLVYGNLTKSGTGTTNFNTAANGRTLTVNGNITVNSGTLRYNNTTAQTVTVYGDISILGGNFNVNSGTGHRINIYGNLINNSVFDLFNTSWVDAYFLGSESKTISGTGGTTDFYRLYVDKGSDQGSVLEVTSTVFTIRSALNPAPLYIQNGTIRFSGPTVILSQQPINIPQTGCLSVNGSTVTIIDADASDRHLTLSGKLEILAGILNIGRQSATRRNSIEYAAAGSPEIVISGGTLNVNGQIRRSTDISTGALLYRQSGGTINLFGKAHSTTTQTRALLEVLNPGSVFEMTDGSINLVRGGGTTFGDIFLDAENYNITGGAINVGTNETPAGSETFNLYFSNPIWNLTVDGTTRAKTAILKTYPVTIGNNLTINGGANQSVLNTSGLNVDIGGTLTVNSNAANPFQTSGEQVTRFFGGDNGGIIQNGTGTLTFQHLTIDKDARGDIVTKSGTGTVSVAKDLVINEGTLSTATDINLSRHVYNYAATLGSGGKLNFVSASQQHIYGDDNVEFGAININNASGVVSNISCSITCNLEFTNGYLDIGDRNLIFTADATVTNTSGTGVVVTNGALSDAGVTKEYMSTGGDFTFPIGVSGKFTPATLDVTDADGSAGTITVKPINSYHPAVRTGYGNDELQYYWNVTSTGFGANPTITHTYNYVDTDAAGTDAGYVAGRFYNYEWLANSGVVDEGNDLITHEDVNYIDGEYTAGLAENFVTKPILYSITSGDWEDGNNWSTSATEIIIYGLAPDGNPIIIRDNHIITINLNQAYAYSVDINDDAVLDVLDTREHNLGHVSGGGTIRISATSDGSFIFPGGFYNEFMNTTGSTIEYSGTGTLPASITTYQNITFSGADSYKFIPAINILVKGNLLIDEGYLDNTSYNRNITVNGNWTSNVLGGFMSGRGLVTFNGLSSTITATGGETFYNLRVNRTGGQVTLASQVSVTRYLYLTRGYINTDLANILTLTWTSTSAIIGGSSLSFIDGPLKKNISAGSSFYFPNGDGGRYGRTRVFNASTSGYWIVEYFNEVPSNRDNLINPLQLVSTNEYWTIQGPASSTANILLRWDSSSDIIPPTSLGRQKLRVAQYLSGNWQGVGTRVTDGGVNSGTVQTIAPATTNGLQLFTLGLDETATAIITGTDGSMCDDGSILTVTVELTGDGPWSYTYTINGGANIPVTAGSSPDYIIFDYDDLFSISGVNSYIIELTGVKDGSNDDGVTLTSNATLTLLQTPNPVISGNNEVITETQEIYSVAEVLNETYFWSISRGSINSGQGTHSVTVDWGADPGAGYVQVEVTNSVSGCSRIDIFNVQVRKNLQIIATDQDKVYGSELIGGTLYTLFMANGLVDGETIGSVTVSYLDGHGVFDNVDLYENAIVISDATGGTFIPDNYIISYVDGDLQVTPKALSITADDKTKVYDGFVFPEGNYTVTYDGFVVGEDETDLAGALGFSGTAITATNAGTYVITPGGLTSSNYNITFIDGELEITAATLTITADDKTKVYDGYVFPE